MAEVSGIGGTDFSVAKGAIPPEENGRLNRPVRDDARPEDGNTASVRSNEAQTDQRSTQPSQTANDGEARQNAANTGGFTAGGADLRSDTVFISPEAQSAVEAEANAAQAATTAPNGPDVPQAPEDSRGASDRRDPVARVSETEQRGPAQSVATPSGPAVSTASAPDTAEPAAADETNQRVRNENTNAEINGSEADQSEQSRTIGQVVDVFA